MSVDYAELCAPGFEVGAPRWAGLKPFHFVGGNNDAASVPADGLAEAARAVLLRRGADLATYHMDSGPQGVLELRQMLADKLVRDRGMRVGVDDLLITSGSGQAIQLINSVLLTPGDTVVMEGFSYQGTINAARQAGAEVIGVHGDAAGMRIDLLERVLDDLRSRGVRAKYIYTIPTVQNPTGTVMSLERRRQLLALAAEHGVPVFEDECYADLLWAGEWPPALHGLDESGQVIHIGSLSKNLAPAIRLGYVAAPWEVLSRLLVAKTDGGTGALGQLIVAEYFRGHFEEHMGRLRPALHKKCEAMLGALEKHFGTAAEVMPPKGGLFVWVQLPDAVDTLELAEAALAEGVAINPGPDWAVDRDGARHLLRLCFAHPSEAQIEAGVAKLAEVCHRLTGVPARSANVVR